MSTFHFVTINPRMEFLVRLCLRAKGRGAGMGGGRLGEGLGGGLGDGEGNPLVNLNGR